MKLEFLEHLSACGNNKDKLLVLMSRLDEDKRLLKSRLRRLSSEPEGQFGRGRERQIQIRKIKDRSSFLTEEREAVRAKLGALKMDAQALHRATHRKLEFCHAFMAAAESVLPEEDFLTIESRASVMLSAE